MKMRELSLPASLDGVPEATRSALAAVLRLLETIEGLEAVVLGGSLAAPSPRRDGDGDLWVFSRDVERAEKQLLHGARALPDLSYILGPCRLPWFGSLVTILFHPGGQCSVDVGLAEPTDATEINTGPGSIVLWSVEGARNMLQTALQRKSFRQTPRQRAEAILNNLIKLRKAISREELFGALEYLGRARREVIGLLWDANPSAPHWARRPDRELNGVLRDDEREELIGTHGALTKEALATAGRTLARLALRYGRGQFEAALCGELRSLALSLAGADPTASLSVGVVGVGRIGAPMANALLDLGFPVSILEVDEGRARLATERGALIVDTDTILAKADVILLALPNPEVTESLLRTILRSIGVRRVLIDVGTNTPLNALRLSALCDKHGHGFVDAPISGSVWAAREGRLSIMVGGLLEDVSRARPLFAAFGGSLVHAGGPGTGCAMKLLHNMLGELEVQGVAEALCVGLRLGIPAHSLWLALSNGMAGSRVVTQLYGARFDGPAAVNVPIDTAEKDQRLLLEMAAASGVNLTWTPGVHARLRELQGLGLGGMDVTETVRWFQGQHQCSRVFAV